MLRPRACQWFELITSRADLAPVLAALASGGSVELQAHERRAASLAIGSDVARALERFRELARTYCGHWPVGRASGARRIPDPAAALDAGLASLEAWRTEAEPLIAGIERTDDQLRALDDLGRVLGSGSGLLPPPTLLASAGRLVVDARVYALPAHTAAPAPSADLLQLALPAGADDAETFVVLTGRRDAIAQADERLVAHKARRVAWPADLGGSVSDAASEVAARRATLSARRELLGDELRALAQRHALADALADIELVEWLLRHGSGMPASDRLVWVTGWTTAADAAGLYAPLHAKGLRCVVQLSEPPAGTEAPALLANPRWARAFEAFARMVGQPGRDEADPSPLVALIAPLLFGFMFGDVGQGAVLCIVGWLLRKRLPMLGLLVPGGAMAMVFGLMFGSVFAREDLIPALWLHPLQHPVELLVSAIVLGAAILLGGLALNALQAWWRREALRWWGREAGLVLAYVSLLATVLHPAAAWLALAGAFWFALGTARFATGGRAAAFAGGLAHFVEQALQLLVNTVSFARVGAFALAHAGLSVAVVGVAAASGDVGYWIVLVLGNLLVLVLEGMVVGIQTTRLLLFEFFVRFLEGRGRAFRPLPPPLATTHPAFGSSP